MTPDNLWKRGGFIQVLEYSSEKEFLDYGAPSCIRVELEYGG